MPEKTGEKTPTGADKETFGHGREALVEAGKKGGAISAARPEEERKASAQKAAETRAENAAAAEATVHPEKTGEKTPTGADKEIFGHGREALVEAGKKGGAISAARPEEERKASAQKAAATRAERGN